VPSGVFMPFRVLLQVEKKFYQSKIYGKLLYSRVIILLPSALKSGTWRRSGVYLRLNLFLLRERVPGRHRPEPPKAQHARKRSGKRTAADVDSGERPHGGPPKGIGRRPDRADGPTLSGYRTEGRRSVTRPPPYFFAYRDVGMSREAGMPEATAYRDVGKAVLAHPCASRHSDILSIVA